MPEHLLRPAIQNTDVLMWRNLYRMRDEFAVSITALVKRLKGLGVIYVTPQPENKLYRSEAEANGQMRLL
jgi:hypothetical protein